MSGHETWNALGLLVGLLALAGITASAADENSYRPPTLQEAETFVKSAEEQLLELNVMASRADWVKATYITEDTEVLAAKADERAINATVELAKQATRFDQLEPAGGTGAQNAPAEDLSDARHAFRPQRKRGTDQSGRPHGRHVWQGQVVPARQGQVPGHRGYYPPDGGQPRPQ